MRKIQLAIASFEEIRRPLEAGKVKIMDYLLELLEGNPAAKLELSLVKPTLDL